MQRRRLGKMARVAFHVLERCTDPATPSPLVFSSMMGEIHRTQGILERIAAGDGVSPAAFSLSVHNAIGGLWSLIHGIESPILALAPQNGSPVPAILEATGLLAENAGDAVNVIFCEEDYPDFYSPWFDSPPEPVALALRMIRPDRAGCTEQQVFELGCTDEPGAATGWSSLGGFSGLLRGDESRITLTENNRTWTLARC